MSGCGCVPIKHSLRKQAEDRVWPGGRVADPWLRERPKGRRSPAPFLFFLSSGHCHGPWGLGNCSFRSVCDLPRQLVPCKSGVSPTAPQQEVQTHLLLDPHRVGCPQIVATRLSFCSLSFQLGRLKKNPRTIFEALADGHWQSASRGWRCDGRVLSEPVGWCLLPRRANSKGLLGLKLQASDARMLPPQADRSASKQRHQDGEAVPSLGTPTPVAAQRGQEAPAGLIPAQHRGAPPRQGCSPQSPSPPPGHGKEPTGVWKAAGLRPSEDTGSRGQSPGVFCSLLNPQRLAHPWNRVGSRNTCEMNARITKQRSRNYD
uniref:uncharacterized protein LOC132687251 n=1 Tax=Panthera onca TaxID=9690 RepID=UPI0029539DB6|nr:uncharacterized protein LOC132687251 [Panthera onca]